MLAKIIALLHSSLTLAVLNSKCLEYDIVDRKGNTVIDCGPQHFGSESIEKSTNASFFVQFASNMPRADTISTLGILNNCLNKSVSIFDNTCMTHRTTLGR